MALGEGEQSHRAADSGSPCFGHLWPHLPGKTLPHALGPSLGGCDREEGPGSAQHVPLSGPPDSKQNGDANAMLSDEEAAGLTQPLAAAPSPEERRGLRRAGTRDRNKKAAACFLLSAGDYACADGSVRKGEAPRLAGGEPPGPPLRPWPSSPLPWMHPDS